MKITVTGDDAEDDIVACMFYFLTKKEMTTADRSALLALADSLAAYKKSKSR